MQERRAFGPPGCGKTTWLKGQVARFVSQFGTSGVLCLSHTRTAARELASRELGLPPENVCTLHALCFRALGRPRVAEDHLDKFLAAEPAWALALHRLTTQPNIYHVRAHDNLLETLSRLRNQRVSPELWSDAVRDFAWVWSAWKDEANVLDYTDFIELCLQDVDEAPGRPAVIFVDEAQDLTPLQLELVRKWGAQAQYLILVGDDDQCIYSFSGSTPDAFLEPDIPEEHKVFLKHSYRLPRRVHALAESWVQTLSRRQAKTYTPREEEGEVLLSEATWRKPQELLELLRDKTDAGQTCMILASCDYLLNPTLSLLRQEVIPFHNPYVEDRPHWNPLAHGGVVHRAVDRLLAFLRPSPWIWGEEARCWNGADLWLWAQRTRGLWKRGFKKWAEERKDSEEEITPGDLWPWLDGRLRAEADRVFLDLGRTLEYDLHALRWWLLYQALPDQDLLNFPLAVLERYGPDVLRATPQVVVGTIHSVKGGEADWVFLFPDLSAACQSAWQRGEQDPEIRTFYVGLTRAKEGLLLCKAAGPHADLRGHLCPGSLTDFSNGISVLPAGCSNPAATGRTPPTEAATSLSRPN